MLGGGLMATPELDRMLLVNTESEAIGGFLEWAEAHGMYLCRTVGHQIVPVTKSIEGMLADYFGIDLKKAEEERRTILAEYIKGGDTA